MTERPTAGAAFAEARRAHDKIAAHEDLCSERYQAIAEASRQTRDEFQAIKTMITESAKERKADIKGIYDFLWKGALGIGACMFAIIMALLFK